MELFSSTSQQPCCKLFNMYWVYKSESWKEKKNCNRRLHRFAVHKIASVNYLKCLFIFIFYFRTVNFNSNGKSGYTQYNWCNNKKDWLRVYPSIIDFRPRICKRLRVGIFFFSTAFGLKYNFYFICLFCSLFYLFDYYSFFSFLILQKVYTYKSV